VLGNPGAWGRVPEASGMNGLTFTAGEGDVGRAFGTVTHSTALADASRDFKSAVASMRNRQRLQREP
ncbi:MAG: hypothetical protein WA694_02785, partial [Pseudolabrys sp.]